MENQKTIYSPAGSSNFAPLVEQPHTKQWTFFTMNMRSALGNEISRGCFSYSSATTSFACTRVGDSHK